MICLSLPLIGLLHSTAGCAEDLVDQVSVSFGWIDSRLPQLRFTHQRFKWSFVRRLLFSHVLTFLQRVKLRRGDVPICSAVGVPAVIGVCRRISLQGAVCEDNHVGAAHFSDVFISLLQLLGVHKALYVTHTLICALEHHYFAGLDCCSLMQLDDVSFACLLCAV